LWAQYAQSTALWYSNFRPNSGLISYFLCTKQSLALDFKFLNFLFLLSFLFFSVALLTVYDMLKAVDRGMLISEIKLLEKSGGQSGLWQAK
jgi:hypothetical protein